MAVKDILADKTKKRTIAIIGTIIIVLATAGIFWHEANTIAVKEPPSGAATTGNVTTTPTPVAANETGNYHMEYDGTIQGSSRYYLSFSAVEHEFPIEEGAKRAVITASSDVDVDLFIHCPAGETIDSSATAETTETVELDANELAEGGVGTWDAGIKHYSTVTRPMNSANYHLVIDVYYR